MNTLDIDDLLRKYDEGDLTTKELLGLAFSYLDSHRGEIEPVLAALQCHTDKSIRELEGKLLTLLGVAHPTQLHGERFA